MRGARSAAAPVSLALSIALLGCGSAPAPAVAPAGPPTVDSAFAFRDPRDGAPPPPLPSREARAVVAVAESLRRGDSAAASRALARVRRGKGTAPAPVRLADAYLAVGRGDLDGARTGLSALTAAHPSFTAAVEAEADLAAKEGRAADALERYRVLLRLDPGDRRASARLETLRSEIAAAKRLEAEAALQSGDLDAARRGAHALLQLEPGSTAGLLLLSRAAAAGGKPEDAWTWAKEAQNRAPADRDVAAFAADAAARAGRWADAASLYEGLAGSDRAFVAKAEEARIEFKVQNLPEQPRLAAESARLTRAQLASLLWWTIPEFRDAPVSSAVEIATDVVDRPDRAALVKAIGLGFFVVPPETHRVGAESPVSRGELAGALRRVATLAGRGRPPGGCLAADPPRPGALSDCGILSETPSRNVTGREALRALEKAARLGREGGTR